MADKTCPVEKLRSGQRKYVGQVVTLSGVLVTVGDHGDGVVESIREKIFAQFFTTKPAGGGKPAQGWPCVSASSINSFNAASKTY